jgi:type IV secretion system protein VirB9
MKTTCTRGLVAAVGLALGSAAHCAEVPLPGKSDPRVRYVKYVADQVTVIKVRRGSVTRIMLEGGEKIAVAATGFSADCAKAELEWCVRADVGTNQVWIKPKDGATFNNLELNTNKRDYSLEFQVLKDSPAGRVTAANDKRLVTEPMFRVIFQYPLSVPLSEILAASRPPGQANDSLTRTEAATRAEVPKPRNWNYSMQVLEGAEDITPTLVFDDGRFTYFQFLGNREVPSIFYVSRDGEEGRINYHMEGDIAVVERMSRKFVLRLGQAVIGVFNEAFDLDGVPPSNGTTSERLVRTLRAPQ